MPPRSAARAAAAGPAWVSESRIIETLRDAGIDDPEVRMRQYPHELSGGQRQRVLIAIALACKPRVLIADEPTSALDVTVQRRILDHLEMLVRERGISMVLITHDLAVAAERSHRMLVLDAGEVVEQGPTAQVLAAAESPVTRRLLAAAPKLTSDGALALGRYVDETPDAEDADGPPLIWLREVSKAYRAHSSSRQPSPVTKTRGLEIADAENISPSSSGNGMIRALDNVSLNVARGQTLGIVGESGSGKSTLLRIALALTKSTTGEIEYDGQALHDLPRRKVRALRRRFQLVQQDPFASLDPRYSVGRCIAEPLAAFRMGNRRQRRARVSELLEMVGLPVDFANRLPRQLSGGQRQRVAVARALAVEPETIYLDEPVSALDVTVQARLLDTLVEIQRKLGVTYVFVSHDLAVVAQVAHHVAVLRNGRPVEVGPAPKVLRTPRTEYTRALIDAVPRGRARGVEITSSGTH